MKIDIKEGMQWEMIERTGTYSALFCHNGILLKIKAYNYPIHIQDKTRFMVIDMALSFTISKHYFAVKLGIHFSTPGYI